MPDSADVRAARDAGPAIGRDDTRAASTNSLGQLYLDWDERSLITQHAGAYSWEVLQSYMRDHIDLAQLKANNPNMRLFMYFETAGAYDETPDATWPSGMPYQWVKANHPDWILKDGAGKDITFWNGSLHLYDVGNPAYQDEWAKRAVDYARSGGFHGVFGDDVNMGESFLTSWSGTSSKYASNIAWTRAVESFLERVSPKLKSAGITFMPNVASLYDSDRATQVRWAKLAGAYAREHYQSWSADTELLGGAMWAWMASLHRDIVAAGIPFYAFPHGGGAQATDKMRYTRASFLLWHESSVGGGFAYSTGGGPQTGRDPYNSAWTFDLGAPKGAAVEQPKGVWTRSFAQGKVVVDSNTKKATIR
ncbi:putative glycoside hydrolase [Pendulispora albinea]|uniref:Glycoside hydrolase family 15 protein n=1 Tax=Pendulispora albinea TaxID=2741071 RepID=A0ABZ2M856_9BACT